MILRKTEEMKREDFDPMKAGIPLDEFLEQRQKNGHMILWCIIWINLCVFN